ncbi:MAG TPA: protein-L-isoaspartate(D-aspartate) O-methyltransferase [Gemmatimonadales bacterium]|nr:protein-L-isoaspartate(D-aspartate) O-methyltransferase [Gemmatimonadales bacterium]
MGFRGVNDGYGGYRARLVEDLRAKGIRDLAVLRAFGEVPRHLFVPQALWRQAYEDTSLPIGNRQTISQPSTQAHYLEALALTGSEQVLEIGTGSGYQTALLSMLAEHVVTIERIPELAQRARKALLACGIRDVNVVTADGSLGWRPSAPYDAMLVAAASPGVPAPLVDQLADGGRLVIPVVREGRQLLLRVTRSGDQTTEETLGDAQFVPLIGRHGFESDP